MPGNVLISGSMKTKLLYRSIMVMKSDQNKFFNLSDRFGLVSSLDLIAVDVVPQIETFTCNQLERLVKCS